MARAVAKYIRMSPRKVRRVIDLIRGRATKEAKTILKFMPYSAARVVEKVLNSAVANAKENENLNPEELKISKAFVDQSVTLKRWRAMSRGRGFPILKRTSHVTIEVTPGLELVHKKAIKFEKPTVKTQLHKTKETIKKIKAVEEKGKKEKKEIKKEPKKSKDKKDRKE